MRIINPRDFQKKNFLSPDQVIEEIGINAGDIVLDYGCGSGFWTVPMAKRVGRSGLVVATDQSAEKLSLVRRNCERVGVTNVKLLRSPYNSKIIPAEEKFSHIIISNILSIIAHAAELILATSRNCNSGTRLLIVDWQDGVPFSGKGEKDLIEQDIVQAANEAGYRFERSVSAGSFHYGLLFVYTGEKYDKKG